MPPFLSFLLVILSGFFLVYRLFDILNTADHACFSWLLVIRQATDSLSLECGHTCLLFYSHMTGGSHLSLTLKV